jgi:transposase
MYKRKGLKNAEIAKKLGVSEITVYTKCNMYEVHTRSRIEEADDTDSKN